MGESQDQTESGQADDCDAGRECQRASPFAHVPAEPQRDGEGGIEERCGGARQQRAGGERPLQEDERPHDEGQADDVPVAHE